LPCTQNIKISLSKYILRILSLNVHAVYADAQKQMHAFTRSKEIAGGKSQTYAAIANTGQAKEDFILN
jgi:hypothetical protein